MLLISQGIGDKPYTRERNNSIYLLKILNVLLSENKKVYCMIQGFMTPEFRLIKKSQKIQNVCLESAIV